MHLPIQQFSRQDLETLQIVDQKIASSLLLHERTYEILRSIPNKLAEEWL